MLLIMASLVRSLIKKYKVMFSKLLGFHKNTGLNGRIALET